MSPHDTLIYLSIIHHGNWDAIYDAILNKETPDPEEVSKVVSTIKSKAVTIIDSDFPTCLKNIYKPPFVIFYYGDLSLLDDINKNISVIGSRDYSSYGKFMTELLVKDICARYIVVSGLARGVDSIAHRCAIKNGGKTVAVLGSGIDYCYPKSNLPLYEIIKRDHLVISEYPNDQIPIIPNFPARNRLIACLSRGLLVTEAHERSGTQITVQFALMTGKDVMCVPYLATQNTYNNRLISEGAYLVQTPQDVIDIMEFGVPKK